MNPWQVAKQIAFVLGNKTWADSPGQNVLVKCIESIVEPHKLVNEITTPFATVAMTELTADEENQEIVKDVSYRVAVVAQLWSDNYGRAIVVGANQETQGGSGGRGLLELTQYLMAALDPRQLTGLTSVVTDPSVAQAQLEGGVTLGFVTFTATVKNATRDAFYDTVFRLKAVGGVGSVALSWSLPPVRFDTLAVIVRRGANPGDPAPTTVTGGVSVPVAANAVSVVVSSLLVGTYGFSVFMAYDETHEAPVTADRYSDRVVVSGVVT